MKKQVEKKSPAKTGGEKFAPKYGVEQAGIYKGDSDRLCIPPKDHPLYDETSPTTFDELRVREIDRTGKMTDAIEVWTDPDRKIMWVVDGRSRLLDVREVNRRRTKDKRLPVKPLIIPFDGDEKEAVARVRVKNYHRRVPKPSEMGLDIRALRAAGWSWEDCAEKLHVVVDGAESWARRLLPLAYCVPEVRAAFDAGELPRTMAQQFGGKAPDGTEALGKKEQLALLADRLATKNNKPTAPKQMAPKARERVAHAMTNGTSKNLSHQDRTIAEGVAAGLALAAGDAKALDKWPDVAAIAAGALVKKEQAEES